jgi:phosphoheptose isomerase
MTAPRVDPTDAMREHIAVVEAAVAEIAPAIERFGDLIVAALGGGGTVLTFGNGGSAADAHST